MTLLAPSTPAVCVTSPILHASHPAPRNAPSPVSALLSGASLAVALYALARFHLVAVDVVGTAFSSAILVAFGLLSLAVALPFIVAQGDLKRLSLFGFRAIRQLCPPAAGTKALIGPPQRGRG